MSDFLSRFGPVQVTALALYTVLVVLAVRWWMQEADAADQAMNEYLEREEDEE